VLQILQLSIDLGMFTGDEPEELGLIGLLEQASAQPEALAQPIGQTLLYQTLQRLLAIAQTIPIRWPLPRLVLVVPRMRTKLPTYC
jgi:hypothetical protein